MYLLFVITLLSFLMAFAKHVFQPIEKLLLRDSEQVTSMKEQLRELKKELIKTPMKENYIEYVKIERKIVKVEKMLADNYEAQSDKRTFVTYVLSYGTKLLLGIMLFLVVVINRSEPVIIFSERFNFVPFSGIISFASKFNNSISVPFWVFVNNYVFRQLASELK